MKYIVAAAFVVAALVYAVVAVNAWSTALDVQDSLREQRHDAIYG